MKGKIYDFYRIKTKQNEGIRKGIREKGDDMKNKSFKNLLIVKEKGRRRNFPNQRPNN